MAVLFKLPIQRNTTINIIVYQENITTLDQDIKFLKYFA